MEENDNKREKLWSLKNKLSMLDHYAFGEFFRRMIR